MIYLFLAEGFEEVEALCPVDVLRRAGLDVTTVGVGGAIAVGAHGVTVTADLADADYDDPRPTMVILPGGMPGALHLDESSAVDRALAAAHATGGYLAAICAAPLVLGRRGYLVGHKATCYPGFEHELQGAAVTGDAVVRDGSVITASGMGVALEFALELVATLKGRQAAERIAQSIHCAAPQKQPI